MKRLNFMNVKKALLPIAICGLMNVNTTSAQTGDGTIDFENGTWNGTHTPSESFSDPNNLVQNSYFLNAYGVQFFSLDNNRNLLTTLPRYAKVGGSTPKAFSVNPINFGFGPPAPPAFPASHHYQTVKGTGNCGGYSGYNDHPVNTTLDEGCWFLSDDDGTVQGDPHTLQVVYDLDKQQCTVASGYLIDIDGYEAFHIRAYTNGNTSTPAAQLVLSAANFINSVPTGLGPINPNTTTGDAVSSYWELNTSSFIESIEIDYIGSGNKSGPNSTPSVGIAFDEFSYCTPSNCLVDAQVHLINDNDGSGRIQLFDQSIPNSNTTIVSRTWTVETINTDRIYIPGGPVFEYFVPVSDNYLVCLEIVAINNITGECCTSRACEWFYVPVDQEPCAMDPGFSFSCFTDDCIFQFNGNSGSSNRNVRGWFWTFGDGSTSNDQSPIHAYENPGTYEVCLTITGELGAAHIEDGACCTETFCRTITFNCVGVEPLQQVCDPGQTGGGGGPQPLRIKSKSMEETNSLDSKGEFNMRLAPNPIDQDAKLNFVLPQDEMVRLEIIDVATGKLTTLIEGTMMPEGSQNVAIDGSNLSAGTYILNLQIGGKNERIKMVVMP